MILVLQDFLDDRLQNVNLVEAGFNKQWNELSGMHVTEVLKVLTEALNEGVIGLCILPAFVDEHVEKVQEFFLSKLHILDLWTQLIRWLHEEAIVDGAIELAFFVSLNGHSIHDTVREEKLWDYLVLNLLKSLLYELNVIRCDTLRHIWDLQELLEVVKVGFVGTLFFRLKRN